MRDKGLANFKDCKNLTYLVEWRPGDRRGPGLLQGLQEPDERSELNETQVSDTGLAHFKDCKNLTILGLIARR